MPTTSPTDLYYFALVVEHGGYSAACRATGIQTSKLSRHVSNLERRLGVELLRRTSRKLTLTEVGEAVYKHSREGVIHFDKAYEQVLELSEEPIGTIRLACPIQIAHTYLPSLLPEFLTKFPRVNLEVEATDRVVDLLNEPFDVAIRVREQIEESSRLVAKSLMTVDRIVVASPSFLKRFGQPGHPNELAQFRTVSYIDHRGETEAFWALRKKGGAFGRYGHRPRLMVNNLDSQLKAAQEAVGLAYLPSVIVRSYLKDGRLRRVLKDWEGPQGVIHLVFSRPLNLLPSVRNLIDHISTRLPEIIESARL